MLPRSATTITALALGVVMAAAGPVGAADRDHPVVIELFQSQGCSSCPPANANVLALAERPDVLALSFQVTYWDQLGWKDTFASPQVTQRQWDYARTLKHSQVWTPQVVVNGRIDTVGTRRGEIEQVIAKADRGLGEPQVRDPGATGPRRFHHRGSAALGHGLVALAPAQQPLGDRGRDAGQEDRGDQPTHDGDGQGRIEAGALQRQGQ